MREEERKRQEAELEEKKRQEEAQVSALFVWRCWGVCVQLTFANVVIWDIGDYSERSKSETRSAQAYLLNPRLVLTLLLSLSGYLMAPDHNVVSSIPPLYRFSLSLPTFCLFVCLFVCLFLFCWWWYCAGSITVSEQAVEAKWWIHNSDGFVCGLWLFCAWGNNIRQSTILWIRLSSRMEKS